jgi:hypothetical protein
LIFPSADSAVPRILGLGLRVGVDSQSLGEMGGRVGVDLRLLGWGWGGG